LDSQSIIALVCAVGGAIGGLVYFLTGSIKATVDAAIKDILESLEELTKDISSLRVTMAERNAAMSYLEREIDSIKKNCRRCQPRDKDS
jgi:predicted RNase H-like nuclease (RuvC/YqgF family)